jgi:hypothetical protein
MLYFCGRPDFVFRIDEERGEFPFAQFNDMGSVGAVVTPYNNGQVGICFQQLIGGVLIIVGGVTKRIARVGKMIL